MIPLTRPVKVFFGVLYAFVACVLVRSAIFLPNGMTPGRQLLALFFAAVAALASFLSFQSAYQHGIPEPRLLRKRK